MPFDVVQQQSIEYDVIATSPSLIVAETRELTAPLLAILSGATLVSVAALMRLTGLALEIPGNDIGIALAALVAALIFRQFLSGRPDSRFTVAKQFAGYVALLGFVSLAGVIATYPLACLSRAFSDPILLRSDQALRFQWVSWYEFVSAHRPLQIAGRIFYDSVFVTPVVLCAYFAYFAERSRAHLLIASYWLAVVVTLALFALFPARGPLVHLSHGLIGYVPKNGLDQAAIIEGLKQHRIRAVSLGRLQGLVSVPSFHTTAAILFIISAWPLQKMRWPVLVINVLMLASIPVEGAHYLTDMIAGALVAVLAQAAIVLILRRRDRYTGQVNDLRALVAG